MRRILGVVGLLVLSAQSAWAGGKSPLEIGAQAPDFSLQDAQKKDADKPVTLALLAERGPVAVVFHRGMSCPYCVEHLRGIKDHIVDLKAAGMQFVAIGPDTLAEARDAVESDGEFPFPLLSDPDNKVARAFGLETPDGGLLHGVFVIDQQRRVRLAKTSDDPVGEVSELIEAGKAAAKPPERH